VPTAGRPTLTQLEAAHRICTRLDWKAADVVIVPVRELPVVVADPPTAGRA